MLKLIKAILFLPIWLIACEVHLVFMSYQEEWSHFAINFNPDCTENECAECVQKALQEGKRVIIEYSPPNGKYASFMPRLYLLQKPIPPNVISYIQINSILERLISFNDVDNVYNQLCNGVTTLEEIRRKIKYVSETYDNLFRLNLPKKVVEAILLGYGFPKKDVDLNMSTLGDRECFLPWSDYFMWDESFIRKNAKGKVSPASEILQIIATKLRSATESNRELVNRLLVKLKRQEVRLQGGDVAALDRECEQIKDELEQFII
jgi:hypothetical protein